TIPNIQSEQRLAQSRLDSAKRRLSQLTTEIPAAERAVNDAQRARDAAYTRIEPFLPEHNLLTSAVSRAFTALQSAEADLSAVNNEIARNDHQLREYDL